MSRKKNRGKSGNFEMDDVATLSCVGYLKALNYLGILFYKWLSWFLITLNLFYIFQ